VSVIGTSSEWADLIGPIVPEILKLVVASWRGMSSPTEDQSEDDITLALCRALQKNRTTRQLMFQIRPQVIELEPAAGNDLGRMDIAFIPLVPREDIYFCLESKKLNVTTNGRSRAYASEYVVFGMLRFVTGQYSRAVHHGGMIGYVLDGDVLRAMSNVEANVQKNHATLGMAAPGSLDASSVLPDDDRARETRHQRAHEEKLFCIHHLFMAARGGKEGGPLAEARPEVPALSLTRGGIAR
jgi:hypothetical protein